MSFPDVVVHTAVPVFAASKFEILELLSDKEDVKELMSVSIVITLWFKLPIFDVWTPMAAARLAVFDWREVILLEFPLILICRAEVVSVCDRMSDV